MVTATGHGPRRESRVDAMRAVLARRRRNLLLPILLLVAVYFFHAFLIPVLGALIIGFASWPLYRRLRRLCGYYDTLSASIAVLVVLLVLIVPLSMALGYAFGEIKQWVEWLLEANRYGAAMPHWLRDMPLIGDSLEPYWQRHVAEPQALSELILLLSGEQLGNIYRWLLALSSSAFHIFLAIVFMMITLFFVYKDGTRIAAQLDRVGEIVLADRWDRFSRMVPATVSSTVTGGHRRGRCPWHRLLDYRGAITGRAGPGDRCHGPDPWRGPAGVYPGLHLPGRYR